jgi:hypothetical protein
MNLLRRQVLEAELKTIRALRVSPSIALVRESLVREEELLAQIGAEQGLLQAANFVAQRDADPSESRNGGR